MIGQGGFLPFIMRYLLSLLYIVSSLSYGQVVINEYSAANYTDYDDNYNETEDWFELYNSGVNDIDLNGYYLSDKANNLTKYQINASVSVAAGEHLVVFASGRNEIVGTNIHTNFKIHQTKGNEWVILTDPDGVTVVDSVFVLANQTNQSRGRVADGDDTWGVFTTTTPNQNNTNAFTAYTAKPTFSINSGSYGSNQNLEISCSDENTTIYYTTDGSYPTTASAIYSGLINITTTTVVKAMAVSDDADYLNSFIEYGTFFINDDYTIPILSVSGDELDELLDGDGWLDPHGTIEYYKEGDLVDKARGEFNEHGNDSWGYPQRGFDYITRDQFGYNHAIQDELFRTKDRDKYQRLIIKAAANDNYPYSYGGSGAHIRDAYVQSLSQVADLRMDERSYEPCILFLNGEYWGLYEIREKVDDIDFTDYYYDQDEGEVDYLKTWGGTWIEFGTDTGWTNIQNYILSNDMSVEANYDHAKSFYNTGSLIDYFILNSYVVNADWLNWNTAWWRGTNPDGDKKKWRYTLWDMDNTFDHGANYTGIGDQSANADPCDPESIGDPGGQGHIPIWNALLQNDEFFADYVNRWTDLSNNYFSCDYLIGHLDSLIAIIEPEMPAQIDRWGGNINTWENNVQDMRDFIEDRCETINSGILDCYEDEFGIGGPYTVSIEIQPPLSGEIELNDFDLPTYPFTGEYFGGVEQSISADAAYGYQFSSITFSDGTSYTDSNISFSLDGDISIIVNFDKLSNLSLNVVPNGQIDINGTIYSSFPDTIIAAGEISLTAIPSPNYYFAYWELENGTLDNPYSSTITLTLEEDDSLTAVFSPYPIVGLNTVPGGSIIVDGTTYSSLPTDINILGEVVVEAIPLLGYEFEYWEYNGSSISNVNNVLTTIMAYEDADLTAYFSKIELDLHIKSVPVESASISVNGEELGPLPVDYTVFYGEDYNFGLTYEDNYEFNHWELSEGTIPTPTIEPLTLSFIDSDTLSVFFDKFYNLTIDVEPHGKGKVLANGVELNPMPEVHRYQELTTLYLEAHPEPDYSFEYWLEEYSILTEDYFREYVVEADDTVKVYFSENDIALFIPNSFSPNGDQINDEFKPIGNPDKIKDYNMQVYNEWGAKVFESNHISQGWAPEGTNLNNSYIYKIVLHSSLSGAKFVYSGTILVL